MSITQYPVPTQPYDLSVSKGEIEGTLALFKFGFNPLVNGTEETVWFEGGNIPWPSTAVTTYVSSTDNTNDAPGGTGALTVEVQGLDASYNLLFGVATLNGQTQVEVVDKTTGGAITFLRVFRAFITLSGTNGGSVGTVYIGPTGATAGVPNTVYANFGVSNQTLIAAYTVAAGKTLYLDDINFSAAVSQANNYVTVKFNVRLFGTNTWRTQFIEVLQSNQLVSKLEYSQPLPEKADIECRAVYSGGGNASVAASFQGILVDNPA